MTTEQVERLEAAAQSIEQLAEKVTQEQASRQGLNDREEQALQRIENAVASIQD